jgi:CheY-like chemotaxis protein
MAKILLVEDNEMNRDMLSRRLERRGHGVLIATDGRQGLTLARSAKPDLILMDMSLPVLDGWEATQQLKSDEETRHIPIIALTAHAMSSDEQRAREAGCDDFDTKPIELARLLDKIQAQLSRRRPHEPRRTGSRSEHRRGGHAAQAAPCVPGRSGKGPTALPGQGPPRSAHSHQSHHRLLRDVAGRGGRSVLGELPPGPGPNSRGGKQLLGLVNYYFDASKVNLQQLDVHQVQHELRTPLNHIIGYSEMLQEQATDYGKKTALADLAKIRSAGYLLLDLLETHLIRPQVEPEAAAISSPSGRPSMKYLNPFLPSNWKAARSWSWTIIRLTARCSNAG